MPESAWSRDTVPTPALVIHRATMEGNLRRLADYAATHGLKVRPHTKTHKLVEVARQQLELGAVGLTVAKVGEAETMIDAGDDLLLGYPALDAARTGRLAELARRATIRAAVDSTLAVDAIAAAAQAAEATIGILVDVDTGFHRTGVQTPEAALALAQHVDRTPGVRLDGLFTFPGHVIGPAAEQGPELAAIEAMLAAVVSLWREHGLEARVVSSGSTPTAYQSHLTPTATEIRPGTYVYNDRNCLVSGWGTLDDCAARMICTVVSDAVPGKCVLDAGSKSLTSDRCAAGGLGHGMLPAYPDAVITRLSEEHGEVDLSACDARPDLGQRVDVIMNHVCPCVNLQDVVYFEEDDGSLTPTRVDARGRLS